MDLDLRKAIISNIHDKTEEQLRDMIETSIKENDEKTLPGLGVIFEVIWKNSDMKTKDYMIETLNKQT